MLFTEFLTVAVALIGFTVAIYCPSTISFASEWTRMSGKYMSVYAIGIARYETRTALSNLRNFCRVVKLETSRNSIYHYFSGGFITPLVNSYLMEVSFQSFVYTIVACQVICWISFGSIWCLGNRLITSNKDKLLS